MCTECWDWLKSCLYPYQLLDLWDQTLIASGSVSPSAHGTEQYLSQRGMPSTQSVSIYAITTTVTSEYPPGWTQGHLRCLWNRHLSLSPTLFYSQSDCLTFRAPSNCTQTMCWTQFLTSKSLPNCPSESLILAFLKWFRLLPCPRCHRGGIKWVRPRLWL